MGDPPVMVTGGGMGDWLALAKPNYSSLEGLRGGESGSELLIGGVSRSHC